MKRSVKWVEEVVIYEQGRGRDRSGRLTRLISLRMRVENILSLQNMEDKERRILTLERDLSKWEKDVCARSKRNKTEIRDLGLDGNKGMRNDFTVKRRGVNWLEVPSSS